MSAVPGEVALERPAASRRLAWARHPLAAALLLLLVGCSQTWVGLMGGEAGDTPLYEQYGARIVHGLVPYRDFFFDWPPGAVAPVAAPALLPGRYGDWFHVLAFVLAAGGLAVAHATLTHLGVGGLRLRGSLAAIALMPSALGSIAVNSFDLWPALLAAGALAAVLRGRDRLGLALLGVAIVSKVYPVVLLPLLLLSVARRRGRREAMRGLATCCATGALVVLPFAALGLHGLVTTTVDQLKRGLQMESLPASVLMTLDHLGLVHVHVVRGAPYSLDVSGGGAGAAIVVSTLLVLAALAAVYVAYGAGADDPRRLVAASAAAVAGWVAFGHVLSPQFLVWLFLLVPLVAGGAGVLSAGLLLAACLTTMTWFPGRFWALAAVGDVSWLVLARNLLLVALFAVLARTLLPEPALRSPGVGEAARRGDRQP